MGRPITHAELRRRQRDGSIYVLPSEETAVRSLALFRPYTFMGPSYPGIGVLDRAEVVVRAWEPSVGDEEQWIQDGGDLTFSEWTAQRRA